MKHKLLTMIRSFQNKKILVMGDVMIDKYIFGSIFRISPEAPVPVFKSKSIEYRLGGSANVAANVASLGGDVTLLSQVGNDDLKKLMKDFLKQQNINVKLITKKDWSTIQKTRYISQNQQVIRIDDETNISPNKKELKTIANWLKNKKFDMILISDYNKGFLTKDLISIIKKLKIPFIVDPKPTNIDLFKGALLIKPNLNEAKAITNEVDPEKAIAKLAKQMKTNIVVTLGDKGAMLYSNKKTHFIPVQSVSVRDVSGAGDTFIAIAALALADGANMYEAMLLANEAASLVVKKLGTAVLTKKELIASLKVQNEKIVSWKELKQIVDLEKKQNKKIVFTNGCFDILHAGHIKLLNKAKSFGDILVLGLNTDASVRRYKGPARPINNQNDRAEVLASLSSIDYVVLFDQDDPCELIDFLRPDIHVKGGDYNPKNYKQMPEAKIVHDYGGEVKIVSIVEGKSTTNTLKKMNQGK